MLISTPFKFRDFFEIPVDPLTALPVLAKCFRDDPRFATDQTAIVSPDVGRARLAGKYAEQLGLPLVVMHKRRPGFSETKTTTVVGDIEGKTAILIDDIIAGGSVLDQIPALVEAGAEPPFTCQSPIRCCFHQPQIGLIVKKLPNWLQPMPSIYPLRSNIPNLEFNL